MSIRMRALVLFALVAPVAAIAAARWKPRPQARLTLPNPPVVLEEVDSPQSTVDRQRRVAPAPILPPAIDAQPDDDFTIDGIAVDATGQPVASTRLYARDLEGAVIATGRADDEGRFTLHGRSSRLVVVYAQSGERRGLAGPIDVDRDRQLRVIVAPPGRVRGVVIDARGVPIAGADVTAIDIALDELPEQEGFRAPRVTTDSGGHFALEVPAPGAWTISATLGEQGAALQYVQVLGGTRDVILRMGEVEPVEHELAIEGDGGDWQVPLLANMTESGLVVLAATPDGALLPGDVILRVDGHAATRFALLGDENTTADLEVERPATRERFRANLARTEHVEDDEGC